MCIYIYILSPHPAEAKAGGSEASKEAGGYFHLIEASKVPMVIYVLRSVVVGA